MAGKSESKRGGGRPPLVENDTTTPVNVRVPTQDYDRACSRARTEGVSVSELVRRGLKRVVDDEGDDED